MSRVASRTLMLLVPLILTITVGCTTTAPVLTTPSIANSITPVATAPVLTTPSTATSVTPAPTPPATGLAFSKMDVFTRTSSSPDGKWVAQVIEAFPQEGGNPYYTQLKVSRVDQSATWTSVDEWLPEGLGYHTPRPLFWSKDGRYFYFTNYVVGEPCTPYLNGSDLLQVDLSNGQVEEIVGPLYSRSLWLSLSPNDKTVAYSSQDQNALQVTLHDLATGEERAVKLEAREEDLASGNVRAGNLVWSPDSQSLMLTVAIGSSCDSPVGGKWADTTSIVRVDIPTLDQTVLIRQDSRLFITEGWPAMGQVRLKDVDGRSWQMDPTTGQVEERLGNQ